MADEVITISVKCQNAAGNEKKFKVKRGTTVERLGKAFHQAIGAVVGTYKFLHEGTLLVDDQTLLDCHIGDNDAIDAMLAFDGG